MAEQSSTTEAVDEAPSARVLTFYLPQFHPVPENDAWWGPGFSEWTNVAKARPLYPGHEQPHIPGDLGFYDLRVPETRAAQARLAAQHGVEAFCYWHYWFGAGRTILERPFEEVLASREPDFPFCLAWANQTWTGIWHGADHRTLIEQQYLGPEDDRAHFEHLLPAFADRRYVTVDGRPLFYVFRPEQLPDPRAWVDRWQTMAQKAGLPGLYLVAEVSDLLGKGAKFSGIQNAGFDAGVHVRLPAKVTAATVLRMRLGRKFLRMPERYPYSEQPIPVPAELATQNVVPCVYPNWDNTPRSGRRGLVVAGAEPRLFERHVGAAARSLQDRPHQERLLFVKSWNEWAEGNYLEPDRDTGHGYLEALARGIGLRS
ncbi:MAG: lipopolysaccharide biosynthesis protein [Modestobacter sp.]|nr:lipopolysaccharide biosynthesis protein [Modestobacter sp.]